MPRPLRRHPPRGQTFNGGQRAGAVPQPTVLTGQKRRRSGSCWWWRC